MRPRRGMAIGLLLLAATLAAGLGEAKTFKYEGGPQPQPDTTLSVAVPEIETVTRARGPKVPFTNLQIITLVSDAAFESGLKGVPLQRGAQVILAPASDHPLGFVAEQSVLRQLGKLGVVAKVRHAPIPDDSLVTLANPGDPILEYHLASARVSYLRLRGWLPGRVKIERQGLVDARLSLRSPEQGTVLWTGVASHNLVDAFPRNQLSLVEDPRYEGLKSEPPGRTVDKLAEPIIVIAIVAGLIALFFQNRP